MSLTESNDVIKKENIMGDSFLKVQFTKFNIE